MAQIDHFRIGDVGGVIILTFEEDNAAVDISSATNMQINFRTPVGDLITKTGTLYSSGTDGKMKYTVESGFFNRSRRSELIGEWQAEGTCTIGSWSGTSTITSFCVDDTLA